MTDLDIAELKRRLRGPFGYKDLLDLTDKMPRLIEMVERLEKSWRCFHCNMVFADKEEARKHFGEFSTIDPECVEFFKENGTINVVQKCVEQGKELAALRRQLADREAEVERLKTSMGVQEQLYVEQIHDLKTRLDAAWEDSRNGWREVNRLRTYGA